MLMVNNNKVPIFSSFVEYLRNKLNVISMDYLLVFLIKLTYKLLAIFCPPHWSNRVVQ